MARKNSRPRTCSICRGSFQPSLDKVVNLKCRRYPAGCWEMEVADTDSVPSEDPIRFDFYVSPIRVHEHCYEFISALVSPVKGPEFVGRVVSSLMVGFDEPDARLPDPWGFSLDVLRVVSNKLNLPGLAKLPAELLVIIHKYSSAAPLWCFARAVALKMELSSMPQGTKMNALKLRHIGSWTRGDEAPKLEQGHKNYTRITLDHHGISRVEALDDHPEPFSEKRSGSKEFIVAERERLRAIRGIFYFKDGRAWLEMGTYESFALWDTPTPPKALELKPYISGDFKLDSCAMSPWRSSYPSHPKTINLTTCTGLTFLYTSNRKSQLPTAILAHTEASPRLLENPPANVWAIYVPLPPGEEILSMSTIIGGMDGDKSHFSFMMETKLAGLMHVGPALPDRIQMHSKSPKALIYEKKTVDRGPVISMYPSSKGAFKYPYPTCDSELDNFFLTMWSWAPLENMARVDVYHGKGNTLRGMHIYYENGAQRTIGECRVGFRPCRTWMKPSTLYWSEGNGWNSETARVVFDDDPTEGDSENEWNWADLVGEVHFWLDDVFQIIRVLPAGSKYRKG